MLLKYWREVLVVVLLMLISAFLVHIHEAGIRAGEAKAQLSQLETDKTQALGAIVATNIVMKQQSDLIAAQNLQLQASQQQLLGLKSQQLLSSRTVAALAPSAIQSDLEAKAGGPLSNPEILRKIDDSYTQLPIIAAQLQNVAGQVATLTGEVTAVEKQRDSLDSELAVILPAYQRAYDAAQKKHSLFVKIFTLGLVHDRKLNLPTPQSLGILGAK